MNSYTVLIHDLIEHISRYIFQCKVSVCDRWSKRRRFSKLGFQKDICLNPSSQPHTINKVSAGTYLAAYPRPSKCTDIPVLFSGYNHRLHIGSEP